MLAEQRILSYIAMKTSELKLTFRDKLIENLFFTWAWLLDDPPLLRWFKNNLSFYSLVSMVVMTLLYMQLYQ